MVTPLNRVRAPTSTTGQGTLTLGSAYSNAFLSPAEAGAANGQTVRYVIEEGLDFEIGQGTIGGSGATLSRDSVEVSKIGGSVGTAKMTLGGNATVRFIVSAVDYGHLARLSIASTKQFTVSNTLTLTGTDGSTLNIGGGGTLSALAYSNSVAVDIATSSTTASTNTTSGALRVAGGAGIGGALNVGGAGAFGGALTVSSSSASALAVGVNGATNPALLVDASTASSATGLKIKSAAAAAGLALSVISSGANEAISIDAKGSGTITLGATSTGNITLGNASMSKVAIAATTASTSTTTGALTVAGGMGVAGAIYAGGAIVSSSYVQSGGDFYLSRTDQAAGYITRPNSVGFKTIALAVASGGPLDNVTLHSNVVAIDTTTASTSTTTGALVVAGGVGIAGAGYFGAAVSAAAGSGFLLGSNVALKQVTNYNILFDPSGTVLGVSVGNATDPTNYYKNDVHRFYDHTGATLFLTVGAGFVTSTATSFNLAPLSGNANLIAKTVGGASPQVILFDTTDAGWTMFSQTGVLRFGKVNTSGSWVANYLQLNASGNVSVLATTASTSTTTGSLINAGGFGNAGDAYIGGGLYLNNVIGAVISSVAPTIDFVETDNSNNYWRVVLDGGILGFRWNAAYPGAVQFSSTQVQVNATTASTSTTTGSLINAGGFGNAGNVYIGGNLVRAGADANTAVLIAGATKGLRINIGSVGAAIEGVDNTGVGAYQPLAFTATSYAFNSMGAVVVSSTTASTSTTTGALTVAGGVGIAGAVYAGGDIHSAGTIESNSLIALHGDIDTAKWVVGSGSYAFGLYSDYDTTALAGYTSKTYGGRTYYAKVAFNYLGNFFLKAVSIAATTAATSTTTGALVVSGGLGVAGAGYFGGAVSVGDAATTRTNLGLAAVAASGKYGHLAGKPGIYLIATGSSSWECFDETGATINIVSSTTSGLQEAINAATSRGKNLYVLGGGTTSSPAQDYGLLNCTSAITFPAMRMIRIEMHGVHIVGGSGITGNFITFNSFQNCHIDITGEVTYQGTGHAVLFKPTSAIPVDTTTEINGSYVRILGVAAVGSAPTSLVCFDVSGGDIIGNEFHFAEFDGSGAVGGSPMASYGILVTGAQTAAHTFGNNLINGREWHGLVSAGAQIGVNTTNQTSYGSNHWIVGQITAANTGSGAQGINTFGSCDIFDIGFVGTGGLTGTMTAGVYLEPGATGNTGRVGSVVGATVSVNDQGSGNDIKVTSTVVTNRSLGSSGYVRHSTGLWEVWGTQTVSANSNAAITFAKAFPTAVVAVSLAIQASSQLTSIPAPNYGNVSTSGMTIYNNDTGGSRTIAYRVTGY